MHTEYKETMLVRNKYRKKRCLYKTFMISIWRKLLSCLEKECKNYKNKNMPYSNHFKQNIVKSYKKVLQRYKNNPKKFNITRERASFIDSKHCNPK